MIRLERDVRVEHGREDDEVIGRPEDDAVIGRPEDVVDGGEDLTVPTTGSEGPEDMSVTLDPADG